MPSSGSMPKPPGGEHHRTVLFAVIILVTLWVTVFYRPANTPVTSTARPPVAGAPATDAGRAAPPAVDRAGPEPAGFGADVGFRSHERWMEHWQKHGAEFRSLGVTNAGEYLSFAQRIRDRSTGGDLLELVRADGVRSRFDRASGTFLAFNSDGTIRTCFRPNDGEAYFRRQAEREH